MGDPEIYSCVFVMDDDFFGLNQPGQMDSFNFYVGQLE